MARGSDPLCVIEVHTDGSSLTITINGELDWGTCEPLNDLVRTVDPGLDEIVVDLGGTTFLDSGGLRALIRLRQVGPPMRIVRATGRARRVIDMIHMADYLGITDAS